MADQYTTAEQLAGLNITKESHVKKILKQAKKQRGLLGLPEPDSTDSPPPSPLREAMAEVHAHEGAEGGSEARPDGVPAE